MLSLSHLHQGPFFRTSSVDDYFASTEKGRMASLKNRACLMQLLSAPLFVYLGYLSMPAEFPGSLPSVASSEKEVSWLVAAILFAEGLGQVFLAYSVWFNNSPSSSTDEFKNESDRWRKWVPRASKDHSATDRSTIYAALMSCLFFHVCIPALRLQLFAWGSGLGDSASFGTKFVAGLLCLELCTFVVTWKRPLIAPVLAVFAASSLMAGAVLFTRADSASASYWWGLSNLLYIGQFPCFFLGLRRWQLEITNMGVFALLAYGTMQL
jgi:hypothetical protein